MLYSLFEIYFFIKKDIIVFSSIFSVLRSCSLMLLLIFWIAGCSRFGLNSRSKPLSSNDKKLYSEIAQQTYINPYLWRATLETLGFLPLKEVDPKSGFILSDWHIEPQYPNERFKVTAYILDYRLRADALKINVIRQTNQDGKWQSAKIDGDTPFKIENAILTKAKQYKVNGYKN